MASQNRTHASDRGKAVVDIPTVPTVGSATAGAESATVEYTASTKGGPATTFTALSNPGSITGTGSSSPITVSGLTAGTAYTFTVRGNNATGSSEYSSASNSITPTEVTSFESIATVSVGAGGSSSISFSSIPSTYKHLQIRATLLTSLYANNNALRFNGDTGANYSLHELYGDGGSAGSLASTNSTFAAAGFNPDATNTGCYIVDILDYAETSKYKTTRTLWGFDRNGSGYIGLSSGSWRNTSAITSITVYATGSGTTLNQYSSFALYGIKGA